MPHTNLSLSRPFVCFIAVLATLGLLTAACGSASGGEDVVTGTDEVPVDDGGDVGGSTDGAADDDEVLPAEPDGGIGDSPFGDVPFFAANDDQCASPTLTNDTDDEALLTEAVDCLFAEYDAGTPVVVDFNIPTVEGDSIYFRYLYNGTDVLIVQDSRLDAFGDGSVTAQRCAELTQTSWLPEGTTCTPEPHPGFPEAER